MDAQLQTLDRVRLAATERISNLAGLWQNAGLAHDGDLQQVGMCIRAVDQLDRELAKLDEVQQAAVRSADLQALCRDVRPVLHRVVHEIISRRPAPDDDDQEAYPAGGWLWEGDTPAELKRVADGIRPGDGPGTSGGDRSPAGIEITGEQAPLTADHVSVLAVLAKRPTICLMVHEVASSGAIRNRETVGRLLRELNGLKLVHRPHGVKKGYSLKVAGLARVEAMKPVT